MRISDWSSDVCSSDLINAVILAAAGFWWFLAPDPSGQVLLMVVIAAMTLEMAMGFAVATLLHRERRADMTDMRSEERRVGKSVSVRVDLGGRRIIKNKNKKRSNKDRKSNRKEY